MSKIFAPLALCILALTPMVTFAAPISPASNLDLSLMEAGVLDQDYKYKDRETAAKIFATLSSQLNSAFPAEASPGLEVTSVSISPYKSTYVFRYKTDMSKDVSSDLKKEFTNPAVLSELCTDIFMTERFFSANDHRITFVYHLKNGEKIADLQINNTTCNV